MTWWCSARDVAWSWTWQAYPGVWLFIGALAAWYVRAIRRPERAGGPPGTARPLELAWFGYGLLALWVATDWPVGALGSGYLLTVHQIQWILYSLVAPPLMLVGIPMRVRARAAERGRLAGLLRFFAHPLPAFLAFHLALLATHLPWTVDTLRPWQLGSFGIDMVWLVGGLALWWPIVAPPSIRRLRDLPAIGYLFASTILPTIPAAFLTFSDTPIYGLYELAPRLSGIPAIRDQHTAGLLMKAVGDPIIWLAMSILFFRWARSEQAEDDRARAARAAGAA